MLGFIQFPLSFLTFFSLYIQDKNAFKPPLSKTAEQKLLTDISNGDEKAKHLLIEHNLRLVAHISKKYATSISAQDEFISIGTIGLIKAVNTYKNDKDIRFSTYASKCISNEILMFFRSQKKYNGDISIYEPVQSENASETVTILQTLSSDYDLEDDVQTKNDLQKLSKAIQKLDDRSRKILIQRYGLNGSQPQTQQQIADNMKISRSYVSRIEKQALEKLREFFDK